MLDGSRIERGRKNLRNIKKEVVKKIVTLDQTMRLRILFTGGSGLLSTSAGGALGAAAGAGGFAGVAARGGAASDATGAPPLCNVALLPAFGGS